MSRSHPSDVEKTRVCTLEGYKFDPLMKSSWLRHQAGSQAAMIDKMLLEGCHTVEDIALAISPLSENNSGNIPVLIARVQQHFAHLQEEWNGPMEPHHLRLKQNEQGHWSFDV